MKTAARGADCVQELALKRLLPLRKPDCMFKVKEIPVNERISEDCDRGAPVV